MKQTPRFHTTAFLIWRVAEPMGWDMTIQDVANLLDMPLIKVSRVVSAKGWTNRFRTSKLDRHSHHQAPQQGFPTHV
jgi:hypothetical protein